MGLDLIELSGGSYESLAFEHKKESTKKREAFFVEFAEQIRPALKSAKLAVTGGFRTKRAMEQALGERSCDIVGLARPLTAEPYLIKEMIEGKKDAARENKAVRLVPFSPGGYTELTRSLPCSPTPSRRALRSSKSARSQPASPSPISQTSKWSRRFSPSYRARSRRRTSRTRSRTSRRRTRRARTRAQSSRARAEIDVVDRYHVEPPRARFASKSDIHSALWS